MKVKSRLTKAEIETVNHLINSLAEQTIDETINPKRIMETCAAIRKVIWEFDGGLKFGQGDKIFDCRKRSLASGGY